MASLTPLPPTFSANRLAMHLVAAYVVSPARRKVAGRMGLVASPGGFATPTFGPDDTVVSTQGTDLVVVAAGAERRTGLTSLMAAAEFLETVPDIEWASQQDIPEPGAVNDDLGLDEEAVACLANWFDFGWQLLLDLAGDTGSVDASMPTLWPEHFDPAIETGSDEGKQRASYGASPGDSGIAEPYVYVGPWYPDSRPDSPFWNASNFPGAALTYSELLASSDPADRAASFYREGRRVLTGT